MRHILHLYKMKNILRGFNKLQCNKEYKNLRTDRKKILLTSFYFKKSYTTYQHLKYVRSKVWCHILSPKTSITNIQFNSFLPWNMIKQWDTCFLGLNGLSPILQSTESFAFTKTTLIFNYKAVILTCYNHCYAFKMTIEPNIYEWLSMVIKNGPSIFTEFCFVKEVIGPSI